MAVLDRRALIKNILLDAFIAVVAASAMGFVLKPTLAQGSLFRVKTSMTTLTEILFRRRKLSSQASHHHTLSSRSSVTAVAGGIAVVAFVDF
jgi:hypothetical protein